MRYVCPSCDNAVDIHLDKCDGEEIPAVEVLCATRHPKLVTMLREEPQIRSPEAPQRP